ncbi:hypothetical protein [Roseofilum sp. Guam]|uniref:hypothetical protein n=1 Tax=Roseofilum sp. Guam TaxID=2821502 RepID=UPI001B02D1C1|nr:hypothetical protein [Roseofilum sp. Guam]MBP0031415.1 hypothetical protein [Roseofilum sp. Guam]
MSMDIVITLNSELETLLRAKATQRGQDINTVASELLAHVLAGEEQSSPVQEKSSRTKVQIFKDLFDDETSVPINLDLDSDRAKWEYLQEKHDL